MVVIRGQPVESDDFDVSKFKNIVYGFSVLAVILSVAVIRAENGHSRARVIDSLFTLKVLLFM